jgi:Leucine-rich repeat (LRR) protein
MLRSTLLCSAVFLLAGVASAASPFKDKALETAVQSALRLPKPDFKDEDLAKLSILHAPGKKIKDLTGLEKCKGLADIDLSKNEVVALAPLKDMPILQTLDLSGNQIVDISALAGLVKLQRLELSNNQVADLKPLAKLVAMQSLYLTGNKVKDIAPLADMKKLASLNLGNNQIVDLKPLAKVTGIGSLELSGNQIGDVTPLTGLTQIHLLQLDKNKVASLAPLVKWAKADADGAKRFAPYLRLYVAGNPLDAETKDKSLPALKAMGVRLEDVEKK